MLSDVGRKNILYENHDWFLTIFIISLKKVVVSTSRTLTNYIFHDRRASVVCLKWFCAVWCVKVGIQVTSFKCGTTAFFPSLHFLNLIVLQYFNMCHITFGYLLGCNLAVLLSLWELLRILQRLYLWFSFEDRLYFAVCQESEEKQSLITEPPPQISHSTAFLTQKWVIH